MTAPIPHPMPVLVPAQPPAAMPPARLLCGERFRLRQEYMEGLEAFNRSTAAHRAALRAGMDENAASAAWRKVQEDCRRSRAAFARYREHLHLHHCK